MKTLLKKNRETKKNSLGIIMITAVTISAIMLSNTTVFAFETVSSSFSGNFNVRQQARQTGHVLISRPVSADRDIVDLIAADNIRSLSEYADWLEEKIEYRRDGDQDVWLSSNETLSRKYGDCEDYAFLNAAVLRVLGYNPRVLAVGGSGESHAICVFQKAGKYMWFDNAELKEVKVFSMDGFAKYIFSTFKGSVISEMNLSTKTHTILYVKRV